MKGNKGKGFKYFSPDFIQLKSAILYPNGLTLLSRAHTQNGDVADLCVESSEASVKEYICIMSYALFTVTKLPNNELTSVHTLSLPPLLL